MQLDKPFSASPRQDELERAWSSPARIVVAGGAIRSGKTQAAGRLLVETAIEHPALYLVARSTYRELEDSTKRALLHGDGALPPLIPPELVEQYRASDNLVRLRGGGEILFRSLEEQNIAKLLNLTLAGAMIDQIEELDSGPAGERVFDTLLGRLSDPRGPRKLICVANPTSTTHWLYRRLVDVETADPASRYVHFSLRDNADNLPADYVEAMEATKDTRPHWYRSFVLGEWGAFEGAAYVELDEAIHLVDPFEVPDWWLRFESMDHGAASPTAWHAWAADGDGNLVIHGEHYEAGLLVSDHAARVKERREAWGEPSIVYADPSTRARSGLTTHWGDPASVVTEYAEHGVTLRPGNNNREAGYSRLLELLHPEPGRIRPPWVDIPPSIGGAPRLYIFRSCRKLWEQLQAAPVAIEGIGAGRMVDPKWESDHGHAHASSRYGALSWTGPSEEPEQVPEDPRARLLFEHEQRRNEDTRRRYVHV